MSDYLLIAIAYSHECARRIYILLQSSGVDSIRCEGSVAYGMEVSIDQVDRARELLLKNVDNLGDFEFVGD